MSELITIGVNAVASPISIGVLTPANPIEVGVALQPVTVTNPAVVGVESAQGSISIATEDKSSPINLVVDNTRPSIQVGTSVETSTIQVGASYTGAQGIAGVNGKSAYEVWVSQGNIGSEYEFLMAIKGARGEKGEKGETVIFQVTKEGFLEVWNGLEGDEIDPTKINLEQFILRINTGSQSIDSSKISVGATSLDVKMSSFDNELTDLGARTEVNEASITVNSGLIATKVSQTDFDVVEGRLDTAESTITQNTNAIALKVSQTDYDTKIGELEASDIIRSATAPVTPTLEQFWLDTSVVPNKLQRWNGTEWERAYPEGLEELDPDRVSTIGTIIERLTTVESESSITANAIVNTVTKSELETSIATANGSLKTEIETQMAQTYLTEDSFNVTISQINQIGNVVNATNTMQENMDSHFDFGLSGMTIRQSDVGSKLFLDAQSVQIIGSSSENFVKQDGAVMYITGNNMYIENAEVVNSIKIGKHLIKKLTSAPTHTVVKFIG